MRCVTADRRSRRLLAVLLALSLLAPAGSAFAQDPPGDPSPPVTEPTPPGPPPGPTPEPTPPGPQPPPVGQPGPVQPGPAQPVLPPEPPPPLDAIVPEGGMRSEVPEGTVAAPPGPWRDPTPQIRVLLARIQLTEARSRLDTATAVVAAAEADRDQREDALVQARSDLSQASAERDRRRAALRDSAVASYMFASGGTAGPPGLGFSEQLRGEALAVSVTEHHVERVEHADRVVAGHRRLVEAHERAVEMAEGAVRWAQDLRSAEAEVKTQAEAELAAAHREDSHRLFERVTDAPGWQLEIMGESAFSSEELVAWITEQGRAGVAPVPSWDLAAIFHEEAAAEGMRGDVAFAQAIVETGWFTNDGSRRFNNFAGVGHCDSCASGFPFATPRYGVRAQIQLLDSYVVAQPVHVHPLVDRRLRGPAACCQTWNELTGVWATNPVYGPIVLTVYEQMLTWLVARRESGVQPVG